MSKNTNILKALISLDKIQLNKVAEVYKSKNRINSEGEALEYYIKDLFCLAYDIDSVEDKDKEYTKYLSYLGNQNNPPDFIIRNSDAVEVKKLKSEGASIALNSSHPKDKLYSNDSRILASCKECEDTPWEKKDIIYVIGVVKKGKLKILWFLYGDCYAGDKEIYEKLFYTIKDSVQGEGYELEDTNELGKIKKVDPLGITSFRVRGMWHIENPLKIYDSIVKYDNKNDFSVYSIMKKEKYNSLPKEDREKIEKDTSDNMEICDIEIKDPNNKANLLEGKLIKAIYNF